MLKARVIPVLLLHDGGLVKTKKFEKPVYVGDPINAVRIFNLKEVNELIFLDIDASKNSYEPNYALIEDIAKEAFMPFGYGGGINKITQIRQLLRLGVEKVVINTALTDENFISQAVDTFGSSTIVASVDLYRQKVFSHVTRSTDSEKSFIDYIKNLEKLGVGEMMVNIVERDGTYSGYDIHNLKKISEAVNIPVVGCGGARGLEDLKMLISETECTGAAAGSMFVFYGKHNAVLITYPNEKGTKRIRQMNIFDQKVLILAPHTDDGELGCGATIAKLIENNCEVFYATFSAAEQSVPEGFPKDILKTEVKNATRELGIKEENVLLFNYEVRRLNYHRQEILENLVKLKKEINPDIVFMPCINDIHQDHSTVAMEGLRAFKNKTILGYELIWNNLTFNTTCFINVEKRHVQKKVDALKEYKSQAHRVYTSEDFVFSLAKTRGVQIGVAYAEAFEVIRLFVS